MVQNAKKPKKSPPKPEKMSLSKTHSHFSPMIFLQKEGERRRFFLHKLQKVEKPSFFRLFEVSQKVTFWSKMAISEDSSKRAIFLDFGPFLGYPKKGQKWSFSSILVFFALFSQKWGPLKSSIFLKNSHFPPKPSLFDPFFVSKKGQKVMIFLKFWSKMIIFLTKSSLTDFDQNCWKMTLFWKNSWNRGPRSRFSPPGKSMERQAREISW